MAKKYCKGCILMYDVLPREGTVHVSQQYECIHPKIREFWETPLKGKEVHGPLCTNQNPQMDCPLRQTFWQWLFGINRYRPTDEATRGGA